MKKLFLGLLLVTSFSSQAELVSQRDCATRYIEGSKTLVATAQAFNDGEINAAEYAAQVSATDGVILALRTFCGFSENRQAEECVNDTKPTYKKIRNKMYVKQVVKGELDSVEVSELDLAPLVKGSVKGFLKKITRGDDSNICKLD